MQQLIISYLLQNKECILPGLGTLTIRHLPATVDTQGKQMLPPENEIIFSEINNSKPEGLIKFIADKKHITIDEAEDLLNDFSNTWREKINEEESLKLETIGLLKKDNAGKIVFEKENNFQLLKPILVKEIYTEEYKISEEKNMLTEEGDTHEEQRQIKKSYWGVWAALLAAIAIGLIIFYFLNNRTNNLSVGDHNNIVIDSSAGTYSLPKQ